LEDVMSETISWIRCVPGLLAASVGVAAAVGWQRRARAPLSAQAIGGAAWAVSVALKFAWAVPTNGAVHHALLGLLGSRIAEPLYWSYIGLLTGVFEVGATLAVVRGSRLRRAERAEALAFGVGFGAAEAVVVGLVGVVPAALMVLAPGLLPHQAQEALAHAFGGPVGFASVVFPPLERASALVIHVVTCALVIHGFRVGRPWAWFGVAFAYKSAVDAVAAWAILSFGVTHSNAKLAGFEVGLAVFAIASAWALRYVLRTPRASAPVVGAAPVASAAS